MNTLALRIHNLHLSLRGMLVLEDINLELAEGDFLGLIGPNGAGKTALLKVLLGLLPCNRGTVEIFGKSPQEARGFVGYVPQYANFDTSFPINVKDAVLMGRLAHSRGYWGYRSQDYQVVDEILSTLELSDLSERQIGKLSGGQLQRVLIARALALKPKILLLDEPTASLDSRVGRGVYELLDILSKEMTIILVSHDIGVIGRHVKTIACLNRRLHYHHSKELTSDMIEEVYGCPVDLLAHGHAHRVLGEHNHGES